MTHITLNLPDDLAQQAEAYARAAGSSLENIVETYLVSIVKANTQQPELSPEVQKLYGAVTLPPNFDYKQALTDALSEKYGL